MGVEPTPLAGQDPKSCVAASYTTGPNAFFLAFLVQLSFALYTYCNRFYNPILDKFVEERDDLQAGQIPKKKTQEAFRTQATGQNF